MDKMFDVIVVGAGNGGLAAAANTAKEKAMQPVANFLMYSPPVCKNSCLSDNSPRQLD